MTEDEIVRGLDLARAAMDYLPTYISRSEALAAFGEALRDLDKPVPDEDEDEKWLPAARAYVSASGYGSEVKLDQPTRQRIAGLKAALPLMPKEG